MPKSEAAGKYKKIKDVPPSFKTVAPIAGGKAIKLNLRQANILADLYAKLDDKSEGGMIKSIVKAKSQFRKVHIVKGGKWMRSKNEHVESSEEISKLNEVWVQIAGSYEEDQRAIRDALRSCSEFGVTKEDWDLDLEATFADTIMVRNSAGRETKYYQASWSKDDKGVISFSDIQEVEAQVAFKAVNEQEELIKKVRKATSTRDLNETILTPISVNEDVSTGKLRHKGSAKIAQRAGVRNGNGRLYQESALKEAVADVQMRIADHGPLLMEDKHRVEEKDGKRVNSRDLTKTVALINEVNWNAKEKTISLDEIDFVDTQAGKDIVAVLNGGAHLQISQRAMGTAMLVKDDVTGELTEEVNSLRIDGWDFVPPGEASVGGADFQFEVLTEERDMSDKVLTEDETQVAIEAAISPLKADIAKIPDDVTANVMAALKEGGLVKPDTEEEEESSGEEEETPEGEEGSPAEGGDARLSSEIDGLKSEIKRLEKMASASNEQVGTLTKDKELSILREMGAKLVEAELATEAYKRFSDDQKKALLENVDPTAIYGGVDLSDAVAVKDALKPLLEREIASLDSYAATFRLEGTGYPARGEGGTGITAVQVLHENTPNMEWIAKMESLVEGRLQKREADNTWIMPEEHPAMATLNEVLAVFDEKFHYELLNEANEEVTQSDIGPRVASIARVVIPAAWRRMTALQVCDVGTMMSIIEDLPVATWNPAETADPADDINAIEVAVGGTLPTAGIQYTNFPLYAGRKAVRTFITSRARATARGTSMNPEADAIAGLAIDVQHRIDRLLWWLMITGAQLQAYTEVGSYETLTQVGSTDEWASANEGWMQFEFLKTVDSNGNPTAARLGKLYATPADNVLQEVDVREGGGDNTAMVYTTDYSVNWPDGTITLTASGVTKASTNGVEAKYTYTTNLKTWSVVPPANVTLYEHLVNLRQEIGEAKVLVANRHYEPNFLGMSYEMEDLVTSGPQFTASGATAADILDRLNQVSVYAGLQPVRTSALPQAWIPLGERGAVRYAVHTPWNMKGPITSETTGDDYYLAEEYSGNDVPVKDKLSLVGITDLNT